MDLFSQVFLLAATEMCGVPFSSCYSCVYNGYILVKLASNFTYCCVRNPGALEEPIMMSYSKLHDCPADMTGTYLLSGSIALSGLMIAAALFGYYCFIARRRAGGRRFSRVRYEAETEPLLTVRRDQGSMLNYGIQDSSHASAAAALNTAMPPPPPIYNPTTSGPSDSRGNCCHDCKPNN